MRSVLCILVSLLLFPSCSDQFSSPPKSRFEQEDTALSDGDLMKQELSKIQLNQKFSMSKDELENAQGKLKLSKIDLQDINLIK